MRNILLIAKREYLEQIRGRAFKFSTLLLPLMLAAIMGFSFFAGHHESIGRHLGIASNNAALAEEIRLQLLDDKNAGFTVDLIPSTAAQDRTELLQQMRARKWDGLLAVDSNATGTITVQYLSQSSGGFGGTESLKRALNRAVMSRRILALGLKPDQTSDMLKEIEVNVQQLDKDGKDAKSRGNAPLIKAFGMAFLISMPILLYGLDMARSIIDEKTSRIFEVMLSVTKPDQMLAGKLLGTGAVGLTQIAIWVVGATLLIGSSLAAPLLSGDFSIQFTWVEVILFPIYYVLGFFLYSALFSGLAATCETAQELQMYMPLAMVPLWIAFGILPYLLNDPNSVWAIATSLFPLTAPYVMLPRVGMMMPPWWQIGASIGLLMLSIWVVVWFSSRLYRVGILMYGKRATLPEIFRWLRYS